jgi:hypothetical protein
MSLKGSLEPSFLSSLFQIFCDEKKSGLFTAHYAGMQMQVHIHKGFIVHAAGFEGGHRLGEILTDRGVLTTDQTAQAAGAADQSGHSFAKALLDSGLLDETQLKTHIEALAQELLLYLFQQADGEFEYHEIELDLDKLVPVQMNIRRVILETFRMLDEMKELIKRLPSEAMTFVMRDPARRDMSYKVDAIAWRLLSLIHANLPLGAIIRKSSYNAYIVYTHLIALMDAKIIETSADWEDAIHAVEPSRSAPARTKDPESKDKPKEKGGLLGFFKRKS